MGDFKKLRVWQLAKDLAVDIYKLTIESENLSKDFRLKSQMSAAAVSISSNIAEGDELDSNKQSIRHFYFAKGSTAELLTQIIIAAEINYIEKIKANQLIDKCEYISSMLNKLIIARKKRNKGNGSNGNSH
jgi:four helix bundle protein